jgi:Family of unknown function (DUF6535)
VLKSRRSFQAGLYSASLTAFLVESYKNLAPDSNQVNAYYSRQSVVLLAQISAQLAASGSPVPSTVNIPPPYPDFRAKKSDVRINIFWFMSLIFSLTAVLGATLVQQWVRDYMHVFQRYNHPLKRARIRQFLYEGAETWYMPVVVDVVPALIHISLFLFFIGLGDFLFNLNTSTATATTITMVMCVVLYLWSIIAPVHDPQSPYQSPLSGVFWHLFQLIRRRTHRDHSTGGERKRISTNMSEGRVQISMDESNERKKRDARAIRWVIDNLTEDSELEPFVLGIPGSLSSTWGKKVWEIVAEGEEGGNILSPTINEPELALVLPNPGHPTVQPLAITASTQREDTLHDLGSRITRLLKTCTDPGILPTEDARRKRAHACVDAALSLVLSMEHDWEWFAESETMAQMLIYLGDIERIREAPAPGFESPFAVRWTCMSMIAVRKMLQAPAVHNAAQRVISCLADVRGEKDGGPDDVAAKTVVTIDQYLKTGWDSALTLHLELTREVEPDKTEERFQEIVRSNKAEIAELEYTWNILGWADEIDEAMITLVRTMIYATGGVLDYLPHAVTRWQPDPRRQPDKGMRAAPAYLMPQFIPPRLLIQRLWLCVWAFRTISASGWGAGMYQHKSLGELSAPELRMTEISELMRDTQAPIKTQLWRLQDLRDGGLVYILELFFVAIRSSKSASLHSSRLLYIGTFRTISADWKEHRHAVWTQRLLVNLLRHVLPENNDAPADEVPGYIIDEFLPLVANVLAEKKGSHVNDAISLIKAYVDLRGGKHEIGQKAISTILPPKPPKPPKPHHDGPRAATL